MLFGLPTHIRHLHIFQPVASAFSVFDTLIVIIIIKCLIPLTVTVFCFRNLCLMSVKTIYNTLKFYPFFIFNKCYTSEFMPNFQRSEIRKYKFNYYVEYLIVSGRFKSCELRYLF
jgi:hypothetical protein